MGEKTNRKFGVRNIATLKRVIRLTQISSDIYGGCDKCGLCAETDGRVERGWL